MIRLTSIAAAALLTLAGTAAAQTGSSWWGQHQRPTTTTPDSTDRYASAPYNYRDQGSTFDRYGSGTRNSMNDRYSGSSMPMRDRDFDQRRSGMMRGNGFASESDARANCRTDVVWMNTHSHVFHLAGSPQYGHTKHGAFMCRTEAENMGRLAKHERAAAMR